MVPGDELVYFFYRFRTLTSQIGQSSQHLNSCVVIEIYLRIGDVYASNSSTESNYTDSRQIMKEIELFEPHGLMLEWNFPNLGANKANEKSII